MISNWKYIKLLPLFAMTMACQNPKIAVKSTDGNAGTQETAIRKAIAVQYFRTIDKGAVNSVFFNQFTDDVDFYFPKFGNANGKSGIRTFFKTVGSGLRSIHHHIEKFHVLSDGNFIVVEGQEGGVMKDGTIWPDNKISHGRFCCVFEFRAELIKRFYIYVDPDFASADQPRIERLSQKANP